MHSLTVKAKAPSSRNLLLIVAPTLISERLSFLFPPKYIFFFSGQPLMSQSMVPNMPQMQAPVSLPFEPSSRRQLEEMARKGQRHCSLPPVPEMTTPNGGTSSYETTPRTENPMTTSRLFHEFSNRHLREQGRHLALYMLICTRNF